MPLTQNPLFLLIFPRSVPLDLCRSEAQALGSKYSKLCTFSAAGSRKVLFYLINIFSYLLFFMAYSLESHLSKYFGKN
jgi:hypothetical protein